MQDYQNLLQQHALALCTLLSKAYQIIDTQYEETLHILALVATLALGCHYPCGIFSLSPQQVTSSEWSSIVVIDLPAGQISWAIPKEKHSYFHGLPLYRGEWQGFPSYDAQMAICLQPRCAFQNFPTERLPSVQWPPRTQ